MNFQGGTFSESKPIVQTNKLTVYTAQFFLLSFQRHDAAPNTKPTLCLSWSTLLCPAELFLIKSDATSSVEDTIKAGDRQKYFQNFLKDKH